MQLTLEQISGKFTICRLPKNSQDPSWIRFNSIYAVINDSIEKTIIVDQDAQIPADIKTDDEWLMFHVTGTFAFDEAGVVLSFTKPLSENGIGVYVISTFSSDLLLLKQADIVQAEKYLTRAGHTIKLLAA